MSSQLALNHRAEALAPHNLVLNLEVWTLYFLIYLFVYSFIICLFICGEEGTHVSHGVASGIELRLSGLGASALIALSYLISPSSGLSKEPILPR